MPLVAIVNGILALILKVYMYNDYIITTVIWSQARRTSSSVAIVNGILELNLKVYNFYYSNMISCPGIVSSFDTIVNGI